jgi:hypothetical protein
MIGIYIQNTYNVSRCRDIARVRVWRAKLAYLMCLACAIVIGPR